MGLVVFSTPVGDVPVRLGANEAVISSDLDPETVVQEFTQALLALDKDRDHLQRMKAAALAKAHAEFDPERFVERYRALLIRP
jgi:glycosyltransferase involved in cell wall biosynthesis